MCGNGVIERGVGEECDPPNDPASGCPSSWSCNAFCKCERPPGFEGDELPEEDCLGITAEKMQQACGSGPLVRTVEEMLNGYVCIYYARAPEEFIDPYESGNYEFGLLSANGEYVLGEQSSVEYFTGGDIVEIKKDRLEVENPDTVTDFENGFWMVKSFELPNEREGQTTSLWMQNGSLSIGMHGTWVDYGSYELPKERECTFDEFLVLKDNISGKTTTIGDGKIKPPEVPENDTVTEECPCIIMIGQVKGEVDVRIDGKWITAEKGQILEVGDMVATGEDSEVVLYFYNCPPDGTGGVAIIGSNSVGEIEEKDGIMGVSVDPGVATVSVKQLPQFQTDFQVSTPRDVCSVRG
jgi:hypothetical protein